MNEAEGMAGEGEAVAARVEEENQFVILSSDELDILSVPEDLKNSVPVALVIYEILAGE